jgi:hypothetical protein
VDEDDLETIDLSGEAPRRRATRRVRPPRVSRRVAIGSIAVVWAVIAAVAAVAHTSGGKHASPARSPRPSSTAGASTTTIRVVTNGLSDVARGPFVAIVDGTPVLMSPAGQIRRVLADLPRRALIGTAQRGAVLVGYPRSTTRVIDADLGPRSTGEYDPLPAAIELIPDARGRWWSNFGQLEGGSALRIVPVPAGTTPVAHLVDGYLVTDKHRAGLLEWTGSPRLPIIGVGRARVLALDHNLVAWSDDEGRVVHVLNLDTRRAVDIACGEYALTARFSPDRSRLAILRSAEEDSMVLAETTSGRVLARSVFTHEGVGGLTDIAGPPAFQPAPFSFDARGNLALVATTTTGTYVKTFDPSGTVIRAVPAPARLQQVVFVP